MSVRVVPVPRGSAKSFGLVKGSAGVPRTAHSGRSRGCCEMTRAAAAVLVVPATAPVDRGVATCGVDVVVVVVCGFVDGWRLVDVWEVGPWSAGASLGFGVVFSG